MKVNDRNTCVFAENNTNTTGFSIYLSFSGNREFLMFHRHNGYIYSLLKDGIRLSDLRRVSLSKTKQYGCCSARTYQERLKYLIGVIDEYITEECCA